MSANKLGLTLMATLCLSACAAAPAELTPAEEEARTELDSSKYQPASRQIRDNIETQEALAQAAFWSHEYNLNPADLEAAIKFSAVLRKIGNSARAVEVTRTTRALYPKNPYLNAEYAAALIGEQHLRPAIKVLDASLKETPSYGRLWSLKGVALDQMQKYDEARTHYQRALRITPNNPNVMANLGLNYALSGDPHTAHQWLSRAAANPAASENVYANLELVESLVAQAGPQTPRAGLRPSSAPQIAPTRTAPNYAPQSYAPQAYSPQSQQQNAAPRQYGAYQSPVAPPPLAGAPRTASPFAPRSSTPPAAAQYAPQYSAPRALPRSAPQPIARQPVAKASQPIAPAATPQYRQAPTVQKPAQTAHQAASANAPIATSTNVLDRIAKNVESKSTQRRRTQQARAQAQAQSQAQAQAAAYAQYQQQNYARQNAARQNTVQQNTAQAGLGYNPQAPNGYPAPQVPYYATPQAYPQDVQRRGVARRRG